jgi:hypothetical protein
MDASQGNETLESLAARFCCNIPSVLHPLAYLVSCANLYLYSATMCTTGPLLLDYLPIRDSTDLAIISILSSYFLSRVTVLTFLISLSFSHSCYPSYSESPPLYPVHVSQFLLFAYDSFCYDYCTILRICSSLLSSLCIISSLYDSDYNTCI